MSDANLRRLPEVQRGVHLLILLSVLLVAYPATAGELDLGVGLGWLALEDKSQGFGGDEARADFRLGYLFGERYELEAQLIFGIPMSVFDDDLRYGAMLNGVYYFPAIRRTVPYLLLGVGWLKMDGFDPPGSMSRSGDESAAYQAAVGVRHFPPGRRYSVRFEVSGVGEDTFEERSLHLAVSVGLVWRFGDR